MYDFLASEIERAKLSGLTSLTVLSNFALGFLNLNIISEGDAVKVVEFVDF